MLALMTCLALIQVQGTMEDNPPSKEWERLFHDYPCAVIVDLEGTSFPGDSKPSTQEVSAFYGRLAQTLQRSVETDAEGHIWRRFDRYAAWGTFSHQAAIADYLLGEGSEIGRLATEQNGVGWDQLPANARQRLAPLLTGSARRAYLEGSGLQVSLAISFDILDSVGNVVGGVVPSSFLQRFNRFTPLGQTEGLPSIPPAAQGQDLLDFGDGKCQTWGELVDNLWQTKRVYLRIDGRMRNDLIYVKGKWSQEGFISAAKRVQEQLPLQFYDQLAADQESQKKFNQLFEMLAANLTDAEAALVEKAKSGEPVTIEELIAANPSLGPQLSHLAGQHLTLRGDVIVSLTGTDSPPGNSRTVTVAIGRYKPK